MKYYTTQRLRAEYFLQRREMGVITIDGKQYEVGFKEGIVIVKDENKVEVGSLEESNHRMICKYILPGQV